MPKYKKIKITILTRPDDASPKVLADGLHNLLKKDNQISSKIIYNTSFLSRLLTLFGNKTSKVKLHYRIFGRITNYFNDLRVLRKLKNSDAIIISECTPNAFWKNHYGIEELRKKAPGIPIILYEVYYLGNAPSQIERLKAQNNPTIERYDWHLAVTEITEIRGKPTPPWSCVGLNLEQTGLRPLPKKECFAIVDFEQKGYERYRTEQIEVLKNLDIPFVSFEKRMSIHEIRNYYKNASLIFMESPEAFGVPLAECLSCGTAIFTPSKEWPMSWRINDGEQEYLPECFIVYNNYDDLKSKLIEFKSLYNPELTPKRINKIFIESYPHFFYGRKDTIDDLVVLIKNRKFD